ncbi:MAG TPA: hypothetical protein VJT75_11075 [Thermoleophilaceae bacterium]|nr:hypothetical protein [Thermoleophilaceae bacterium]
MRRATALAAALALLGAAYEASAQKRDEPISVGYRDQVFVVARDGGARRLTGPPGWHNGIAWAPRGHRMAMLARYTRIQVRDMSGDVQHEIRGGSRFTYPPEWSPDARRLAFVADPQRDNRGRLVTIRPDGSDRRVVATRVADVAWSRDGETIYYLHYDAGSITSIWSVPSRGGSPRLIVPNVTSGPQVSPDGHWILFGRAEGDDGVGLWVARTDGSGRESRVIAPRDLRHGPYRWAPSGTAIYGGKTRHKRVIVTSLSGKRRSLGASFFSQVYEWSPDGDRLAWVQERYGITRLWSARTDGTDRRVLARFTDRTGLTEVDELEWSPDSRRLAVVPYRHSGD